MSYVTCKYCGKIHKRGFVCEKKPVYNYKKDTEANRFRKSRAWTNKSISIRERDKYLCQCCLNKLEGTMRQYNFDRLSVHHIESVVSNYDARLDDMNLITVCDYHHERCEDGSISVDVLKSIVSDKYY